MKRLREYLDLVKFSHTLFALPFALAGRGAGGARSRRLARPRPGLGWHSALHGQLRGRRRWRSIGWRIGILMRSILARRPGTFPRGGSGVREVAIFTVDQQPGFRGIHPALPAQSLAACISSVPVLLWLLGYSYSKRFTSLAHFWLGLSLSLAPAAAWIALRGQHRLAACSFSGWPCSCGWRASTSFTPARTSISTSPPACTACPKVFGVQASGPASGRPLSPGHMIVLLALYELEGGLPARTGLRRRPYWPSPRCWPTNTGSLRPDDLTQHQTSPSFKVNAVVSVGLLLISVVDILVRRA